MAKQIKKLTTSRLIELIEGFPPDTPVVGLYSGIVTHMDAVQEIMFNKEKCDERKSQIDADHYTTYPELRLHTEDADTFGVMLIYS